MPKSIGLEFGTRNLRIAWQPESNGEVRRVIEPIPVWQAAGWPKELHPFPSVRMGLFAGEAIDIAGKSVDAAQIVGQILSYVHQAASQALGEAVEGCVVGIPLKIGTYPRKQLADALLTAGFRATHFIKETTAIALSQPRPTTGEQRLLIYSLGEGSLQLALILRDPVGMRELAIEESQAISGHCWTELLLNHLLEQYQRQGGPDLRSHRSGRELLWEIAEKAKEQLSGKSSYSIYAPELASNSAGRKVGLELEVARPTFEALIQEQIAASLQLCRDLIGAAGLSGPEQVDEIWLAGGSARTPVLHKALADWSSKPIHQVSEFAVAYGAVTQVRHLNWDAPPPELRPQPVAKPATPRDYLSTPFERQVFSGEGRPAGDASQTAGPASGKPVPETSQPAASPATVPALAPQPDAATVPGSSELLALVQEAQRLFQAGLYLEANEVYANIQALCNKRIADGWYRQGLVEEQQGYPQKAKICYQNALDKDKQHPQARQLIQQQEARRAYDEGKKLLEKGEKGLDQALRSLKDAVSKDPVRDYQLVYANALLRKTHSHLDDLRRFRAESDIKGALQKAGESLGQALEILLPEDRQLRKFAEDLEVEIIRHYLAAIKKYPQQRRFGTDLAGMIYRVVCPLVGRLSTAPLSPGIWQKVKEDAGKIWNVISGSPVEEFPAMSCKQILDELLFYALRLGPDAATLKNLKELQVNLSSLKE